MALKIKETLKAPAGFAYPLRAVKVIFSDWRIVRLAITPMLINSLLFAGGLYFFNWFVWDWATAQWFPQGDELAWYWDILYWLLGGALTLVSFGLLFFGFAIIGIIVAAPFNDFLAAAVERKLTGGIIETDMSIWTTALFILKNESRKMAVVVTIQIALMLVNFIPGVGQIIFMTITPIFMALVMAYEFTGYTLDRRAFSYKQKKAYLFEHPGLTLGFGLAVAATLLVPILNFVILPLAVTGGTMLVLDNPPTEEKATTVS